jgi:hypothetical protein
MQAQLEAIDSRQPPANLNVLPLAPLAPAAQSNLFKMRDPAPFCGGPAQLEHFLGQIKINFESHEHQFPGVDPDKVQYAMRVFRTWLEHRQITAQVEGYTSGGVGESIGFQLFRELKQLGSI